MMVELKSRGLVSKVSEKELHSKLCTLLGLSSNEARLYISMLQNENFTASELSELSGIHRSRIYDNLRGLEAKKLIHSTDQNPLRVKLLSPQEAVSQISQDMIIEHKKQLEAITALGILLDAEVQTRSGRIKVKPHVLLLEDALFELRTLLNSAKERVWVTKRTSGGVVDWFILKAELGKLISLKADIRFLSDRPIGFPFDIRINPDVSLSFALIDHTVIAFLMPSNESSEGQFFVTQNSEYVSFFEQAFLKWWDHPQHPG